MRLAPRTTLTLLLVAVVPLAFAGLSSLRLSERALRERTRELHDTVAQSVAARVNDAILARIRSVQYSATTMEFETLGPAALQGALRLIFRQVEGASAVALFDNDGKQVGVTQFLSLRRPDDTAVGDRPALTQPDIEEFGRRLPLTAAREVGAATSHPYVASDGGPRITVTAKGHADFVLSVELSLEDLRHLVANHRVGARGRAFVVDSDGRVILAPDRQAVAAREDRSGWEAVAAVLAYGQVPSRFHDPVLGDALGAVASIPNLHWSVVVAEPARDALAAATTLIRRALLWLLVAVAAASVLGVVSARALVRPIRLLHQGATALRAGNLTHRIGGTDRADELGDLAQAFTEMAQEIQRWNRELEHRVEQKSRALRETQDLLLRSQKLAAVGELGAGVAHEINNPLTGLLALAQLSLLNKPRDSKLRSRLEEIERQALRIQEIVDNLRRLTTSQAGIELQPTRVESLAEAALCLVEGRLNQQGIEVVRTFQPDVPQVTGDEAQLTEVFLHLISNARKAMPDGGTLTLGTGSVDGQLVSVRISDTGDGIPKALHSRIFEPFFTSKKDWQSKGLGLTLVSKIIESHHGRITVDSEVGAGATFTLLFPATQQRSLA